MVLGKCIYLPSFNKSVHKVVVCNVGGKNLHIHVNTGHDISFNLLLVKRIRFSNIGLA